jgi:hypothetical protein
VQSIFARFYHLFFKKAPPKINRRNGAFYSLRKGARKAFKIKVFENSLF